MERLCLGEEEGTCIQEVGQAWELGDKGQEAPSHPAGTTSMKNVRMCSAGIAHPAGAAEGFEAKALANTCIHNAHVSSPSRTTLICS